MPRSRADSPSADVQAASHKLRGLDYCIHLDKGPICPAAGGILADAIADAHSDIQPTTSYGELDVTTFFRWSWVYGGTLALLLLHPGWGGLASGQDPASEVAATAETDPPESDPSAAEPPADPLAQAWKQHLELAISIAGDFASPAQQQAATVVAEHRLVDSRLDAPVRAELEAHKNSLIPSNERLAAAIALLTHTTIEPRDQVSLLLDLLIAKSLERPGQEATLLRQGHPLSRVPGIAHLVASQLRLLRQPLAEELETRLSKNESPPVLYAAAGLTAEHGVTLIPRLLAIANESDDRFVKAAAFQSVESIFASDRSNRQQMQRGAAASPADTEPPEKDPNTLADRTNLSLQAMQVATRIIQRNDSNGDGVLTEEEWAGMLLDPSPADTNKDGQITREEYAAWIVSRAQQ